MKTYFLLKLFKFHIWAAEYHHKRYIQAGIKLAISVGSTPKET